MMSDRELRCSGNVLFGIVVDGDAEGTMEVRCHSKFCGKTPSTVILHRFNLGDGTYRTKRYLQPGKDT